MPKETTKQRTFSRRAVIFGGVQMLAFTALSGRLFYLQFIKADEYQTLSENNRIKLQLLSPERGHIFDRNGLKLAENEKNYRLFIDYSGLTQDAFHDSIEQLQQLMPLPEKKYKQLLARKVTSAAMPELLKEHMSWEEVSLIELHQLSLSGVYVDVGQTRHYPLTEKAAHLIGFVGTVSKTDVESGDEDEALLRLPEFKIGKNGVEHMLEKDLRGTAGIRQIEVNVHGVPIRDVGRTDSIPGQDMYLTIDQRLQDYAAELIKDESAAVVVMEVDTGNILTLASMPAFEPDIFSKGITNDIWKVLNSNKKNPLLNKAISGQYPPGSTFKMMVGMAGLEAGVINPSSTVYCPGYFSLGSHTFNCWKEGGHGTMDYHHAVEQSCDTFFYTVADRLGVEKYNNLVRVTHECGLGELHNIGIIGEKPGVIPDPKWKQARYKQRWTGGDTINASIGQGYVLSTPLQLAVMAARIAGGTKVEPRLIVPKGEEQPRYEPLKIKQEWLDLTRDAMADVVNSPSGTAYGKRIAEPPYEFAGKTGTSQVRKITQRGVNQNTLPWEFRHHALFVGYAPLDKPKYAVCVVVEHGGGGSAAAAPVARDVLLKIQQLDAKKS
ncbi:MAG: penicillin-binding protein 2 [Rickettsiales bacterium]|nr:penicillin-binding protein 2 [Rickettsiales bacterium]